MELYRRWMELAIAPPPAATATASGLADDVAWELHKSFVNAFGIDAEPNWDTLHCPKLRQRTTVVYVYQEAKCVGCLHIEVSVHVCEREVIRLRVWG
jgi:hypothetical protein